MTKDEALQMCLEYIETDAHERKYVRHAIKQALAAPAAQPAPVQEPIGYLFQHEETGLTMVVDVQQVEWGFEKNNPRHQKIGPVYTTPPAHPAVPLTDEQIAELFYASRFAKDEYDSGANKFARAIEAAHGITKGQPLIDLRQDAWNKINSPEQVAALDKTIVDFASGTKGQP
jgi:hypothetical protein